MCPRVLIQSQKCSRRLWWHKCKNLDWLERIVSYCNPDTFCLPLRRAESWEESLWHHNRHLTRNPLCFCFKECGHLSIDVPNICHWRQAMWPCKHTKKSRQWGHFSTTRSIMSEFPVQNIIAEASSGTEAFSESLLISVFAYLMLFNVFHVAWSTIFTDGARRATGSSDQAWKQQQ